MRSNQADTTNKSNDYISWIIISFMLFILTMLFFFKGVIEKPNTNYLFVKISSVTFAVAILSFRNVIKISYEAIDCQNR